MQTFDLTVVDLKPSLLICSVYSLENATVFCIFCPVFFFTQKYVCGIIAVEFGVISPSGQLRNRMFFFSMELQLFASPFSFRRPQNNNLYFTPDKNEI